MTPELLKARTKAFAVRVITACEALPNNLVGRTIGGQLIRSGTSVGSNYRAACRSRSAAEFVARMGAVEEEADESDYWMELLSEKRVIKPARLAPLLPEAGELCAIAGKSRMTASRNAGARSLTNRKSEIGNRKSRVP